MKDNGYIGQQTWWWGEMEADGDVYVFVSQHNDIMISDVDENL